MEQKAINVARQLEAEFWATSSRTGECVQDFFFRAMCLSFDDMLLKELESYNSTSKQIGNNLLRVQKSQSDLYEKRNKRAACCS